MSQFGTKGLTGFLFLESFHARNVNGILQEIYADFLLHNILRFEMKELVLAKGSVIKLLSQSSIEAGNSEDSTRLFQEIATRYIFLGWLFIMFYDEMDRVSVKLVQNILLGTHSL